MAVERKRHDHRERRTGIFRHRQCQYVLVSRISRRAEERMFGGEIPCSLVIYPPTPSTTSVVSATLVFTATSSQGVMAKEGFDNQGRR